MRGVFFVSTRNSVELLLHCKHQSSELTCQKGGGRMRELLSKKDLRRLELVETIFLNQGITLEELRSSCY